MIGSWKIPVLSVHSSSQDSNVKACLPLSYTADQYDSKDTEYAQSSYLNTIAIAFSFRLIIGLSVSLGLLVFELVGFMGGISMFMPSQGLICILFSIYINEFLWLLTTHNLLLALTLTLSDCLSCRCFLSALSFPP
jgi:hypothetical protein